MPEDGARSKFHGQNKEQCYIRKIWFQEKFFKSTGPKHSKIVWAQGEVG